MGYEIRRRWGSGRLDDNHISQAGDQSTGWLAGTTAEAPPVINLATSFSGGMRGVPALIL